MNFIIKFFTVVVLGIICLGVTYIQLPAANAINLRVFVEDKLNKEEPDEYPMVDLAALQKSVVYPAVAKSNGIEGKVFVRAYVSKKGKVLKTIVDKTDNDVLTSSAVNAVKKAKFTPATKNGKAVNCWVSLPISFRL